MEIRVLGPLEVALDGAPAHLGGPRQRAVLAALVHRRNTSVPTDALVEAVWGADAPPSALTTLRGYVKHLRRVLLGASASIVTVGAGYRLEVGPDTVDQDRFERAIADGRAALGMGDLGRAHACLQAALDAWRGEPYPELDGPGEAERARLTALHLVAVESSVETRLRAGDESALVPQLEALVQTHPLHEGFCGQLIRALEAVGRRADALRVYADLRRRLAEDLGVEPSSALRELELRVLGVAPEPAAIPAIAALPARVAAVVGREAEVERVVDELGRSRLVTITGAGGVGKTTVAVAAATELRARGATVAFVELAAVAEGTEVVTSVATALGAAAAVERIAAAMPAGGVLLLDNCEHVVGPVAELVHDLLRANADLRVLATSREALVLGCERVVVVEGLSIAAAAALLVERATAATGISHDVRDAAVERICARLDGIPLAIELVAPALRVLSAAQLAATIEDEDALFRRWAESRGGPERHRALDAAIDWSYRLLDEQQRMVLCCLATFADRFTLADAVAVCPPEADVVGLVTGLVAKSMVSRVPGKEPTFRLLVPIRSFAMLALRDSPHRDAVQERHARWFLAEAERANALLLTADARDGHARLDACRDDIRAAMAWFLERGDGVAAGRLVAAMWQQWDRRFEVSYALETIEAVLECCHDPRLRLQILTGATQLAWLTTPATATTYYERALPLLSAGTEVERGRLLAMIAAVQRDLNVDVATVAPMVDQAVSLLRAGGDRWWEANALRVHVHYALDQGEILEARSRAERCLELWEACGDVECSGGVRLLLCLCAIEVGDTPQARTLAHEALDRFQSVQEPMGVATSMRLIGSVLFADRDLRGAAEWGEQSLDAARRIGFRRGIGEALKLLADSALHRGEVDLAEALVVEALDVFRARAFVGDIVTATHTLALVRTAQGRLDDAMACCEEALAPDRSGAHRRYAAGVLRLLGVLHARRGDVVAGAAACDESRRRTLGIGYERGVAESLVALAEVALLAGDVERAGRFLDAGLHRYEGAGLARSPRELLEHHRLADALTSVTGGALAGGRTAAAVARRG